MRRLIIGRYSPCPWTGSTRGDTPVRVAVVGAGFAGLINAVMLSRVGLDIVLFEEHRRVGYPKHCTGIVSERTVNLIGNAAREALQASYKHVVLDSRAGSVTVSTSAAKLDRVRLEELLLQEAAANGVRIAMGARVNGLYARDNGIYVSSSGPGSGIYDFVILAEGLTGSLRHVLGVKHNIITSLGLNMEARACVEQEDIIIVSVTGPGAWFSWKVRAGGIVVYGALGPRPGAVMREAKRLAESEGCEGAELYGGRVIHGPPIRPELAVSKSHVIVGDAAALTKPLTGGGLYPNAVLASHAANLIRGGMEPWEAYRRAYGRLYKVLKRQHRLATVLLPGRAMWDLVDVAAEAGLTKVEGEIDYDNHARSLLEALRAVGLRGTLSIVLRVAAREPFLAGRLLAALLMP